MRFVQIVFNTMVVVVGRWWRVLIFLKQYGFQDIGLSVAILGIYYVHFLQRDFIPQAELEEACTHNSLTERSGAYYNFCMS